MKKGFDFWIKGKNYSVDFYFEARSLGEFFLIPTICYSKVIVPPLDEETNYTLTTKRITLHLIGEIQASIVFSKRVW